MKLFRMSIIVAFMLFFPGSSQAAYVDSGYSAGYMVPGNFGGFTNSYEVDRLVIEDFWGELAPKSKLTITYALITPLSYTHTTTRDTALSAHASHYAPIDGSFVDVRLDSEGNYITSSYQDPLVPTDAQLFGYNLGIVTILNLLDSSSFFSSQISAYIEAIDGVSGVIQTSYSVSPVPLPAALPLFGFGFAALAGTRIRRKKAKV